MGLKYVLLVAAVGVAINGFAQKHSTVFGRQKPASLQKRDTLPTQKPTPAPAKKNALNDLSLVDYDELFSELDALLDSLYKPRSFTVVGAGVNKGYFTYSSADDTLVQTKSRLVVSPSFSYFDASGLGISGGAMLLNENSRLTPFQFSLTGSYDFLTNRKFLTGVSFSRFFTRSNLAFYTSPLQNELYGYFTYRKFWVKPSITASYGWGSRSAYESRQKQITIIQKEKERLKKKNNTGNGNGSSIISVVQQQTTTTVEQVADFNLTATLRHDFYFLHLLSHKDYFRFTPQLTLVSGTRQFGFNQTTSTFLANKQLTNSELFNTQNSSVESSMKFKPVSLTAFLKTEYVWHQIFVQPQVAFDYYLLAPEKNFTTSFLLNAGVVF